MVSTLPTSRVQGGPVSSSGASGRPAGDGERSIRMEASALVGKTITAVLTYPLREVHPAWRNVLTPAICTYMAFLELADGELVGVEPCEVNREGERDPRLGLSLERCERSSVPLQQPDGRVVDVVTLTEAESVLPLKVSRVINSDPLGEGAVSEIRLEGQEAGAIVFRHIMPPISLGIVVKK
jgi:hypothetical protein